MKNGLALAVGLGLCCATAVGCSSSDSTGDGGAGDGGTHDGAVAIDAIGATATNCGIVGDTEPNDVRDLATPYIAGTDVIGCLGTEADLDFYQVTAPTADLAGGYFQAAISNVGAGTLNVEVYTASDNSIILTNTYTTDNGGNLYFYWAAAPGQTYRVSVGHFGRWDSPYRYTFKAAYTKINDTFEPNDKREQAKGLVVGTPANGFFFTGFTSKEIDATEYDDWFSVSLTAGMATIKVTTVATDVMPQLKLLNSEGTEVELSESYNITPGGSLTSTATITTAGSYFVVLNTFATLPKAADKAASAGMLPDSFVRPYTLTVTQP